MSDKGLKFYRMDQSALKSNCIPGCVIQYEFSQFIFCFFYFFKEAYENSVVIIDLKNLVVNKQMVCCRPRYTDLYCPFSNNTDRSRSEQ